MEVRINAKHRVPTWYWGPSLPPQKSHGTTEQTQRMFPCFLTGAVSTIEVWRPISSQYYDPFEFFLCNIFCVDILQWVLIRFWAQLKVKTLNNILFMTMKKTSSIHRTCIQEWKNGAIYISVQLSRKYLKQNLTYNKASPWNQRLAENLSS